MLSTSKFLFLVLMGVVSLGSNAACSHEMPQVCKEFYDLSGQQREGEFVTYPVKKQLEIFRCGLRKKPPERGWAYEIAKGGEKIIPDVLQELETEKDEWVQVNIIHVLQIMSAKGYLHNRQDVVDEASKVISRMKYSFYREDAKKALEDIEKKM